jgi:protein-tyrosine phosphatase
MIVLIAKPPWIKTMELTELPFAHPGAVFRSAMPYSSYDPDGELISAYNNQEISAIIMLASDEESQRITGHDLRAIYESNGFEILYLPIPDFGTPDLAELKEAVEKALSYSQSGKGIVIHCHAGLGRTGLFAACLAKQGLALSSEEAINWVREFIPGAVEVPKQEMIIRSF